MDDAVDLVTHFYSYSDIPKGCNTSFFIVIRKSETRRLLEMLDLLV